MTNMRTEHTVLVTGASSGIGEATAIKLAEEGYKVYVAARRVEKMKHLESLGCIALKMDISKDEDVHAVVDRIKQEDGGVDILINNAGFSLNGAIEDVSLEDARYQFDVNFFGLALLTKLVLPMMRDQKFGKIVNVSSGAGKISPPIAGYYSATKFALEGWSDSLRIEVQSFGIDVIVIEPGLVKAESFDVLAKALVKISSADGPYGKFVQRTLALSKAVAEDPSVSSPPSLIADTISEAISSSNPKTRYAVGKAIRRMLIMRRWLSDRFFDRMMTR